MSTTILGRGAGGLGLLASTAAVLALCAACGAGGGGGGGSTTASTIGTSSGAKPHLVDGSGRSVYLFMGDTSTKSTCTGSCAGFWPPVLVKAKPAAAGGAAAGDLGTTKRSDGSMQATYGGHPLYYYSGDNASGDTNGQGNDKFGAKWWLVAPSGSAVTSGASGSGGNSGGNSGGSGGGYNY